MIALCFRKFTVHFKKTSFTVQRRKSPRPAWLLYGLFGHTAKEIYVLTENYVARLTHGSHSIDPYMNEMNP